MVDDGGPKKNGVITVVLESLGGLLAEGIEDMTNHFARAFSC